MDKVLYPTHPVRCIITGPSECGKSVLLTELILKTINELNTECIYSPSLHQDLYQKFIKCFIKNIPIHIIRNILQEKHIDVVIEEIVNNNGFQKSDTEIETYESIEELKFPREQEDGGIIIIDDLNEKKMYDLRVQAMFKRSRHINLSVFIISRGYYELPKPNIRATGNIYHIFKPDNFLDVRNIYQDKASMDMTFNKFKKLTKLVGLKNTNHLLLI